MILSRYCKIYPHKDDPASVLLFSTKKSSKILVSRTVLEDIENGAIPDEEKETLMDLGFLVSSVDEERNEMIGFIDELNSINRSFKAIVVMNLDCNLACRYCFEGARKGRFYMTKKTADQLIDFIRSNISDNDEINLTFYGGEPLLSLELIVYISENLGTYAEQNGIKYRFSFITNGTLLLPKTVERLKPLGLNSAGITLDGPKAVHDISRPFKTGNGSFDVIFKNMGDVCKSVDIQLGGNFTQENYHEFPKLLDYMIDNGFTPEKVSDVKFAPVLKETVGIAPPDFHDGCESLNEPWLFEAGIFLREEIMKRGYITARINPIACMMEYKDVLVVNHNGEIYKCPGLIGRKEFCVGNIRTGVNDYRISHNLDNWKNEECLNCAYLPLCFGGCRYMKFVRDGNMDGVDCKKPYLDATIEELVKQDIRYGLVK
ncbi:MAG: geopeptide radical SAM maturase [Nitrospirae bacterium]|nr:geopeptide radical SAM maturase [Nitrospirota bacterium]